MCRTFGGYKSISNTNIEKLKMKKRQSKNIVEITTKSSYIENYKKKLTNYFFIKSFALFFSGFFSNLVSEFITYYLNRIRNRLGVEININN
jgi:hypothetical protein